MPASRPLQEADPTSLAGYRLTGRLGQGAQGIVYLGAAPDGQQAAIKVLSAELATDPDFRRRFQREAAAAQRVASFCTAQVLDASFEVEQPYIVSEYVDGRSLEEEVERNGPHSGTELHRLAVATATALVAVHEAGIVHRDFKPANVLMAAQGPRVIDFGVAGFDVAGAQTEFVVGTPRYMAPEQITEQPTTPAADVFSWGAVLVFAATGNSLFSGSSIPAVIHKVVSAEADLSGIDEYWRSIVAQCLAKDPAERPTSAELLMTLLGRRDSTEPDSPSALSALPQSGEPAAGTDAGDRDAASATEVGGQPPVADAAAATGHSPGGGRGGSAGSGRKRLAVLASALALLLVAGVGGYAVWGALQPDSPPAADGAAPGEVSASPSPSSGPETGASPDSSARVEVESQDEPSPSAEPEKPSESPEEEEDGGDDQVTFPQKFAGRWVSHGTFPNGVERDFEMIVEAGRRSASLTTSDNLCTWTFYLNQTNDRNGVDGSVSSGDGCGPHETASIWTNQKGQLVIRLWGRNGDFGKQVFALDRA